MILEFSTKSDINGNIYRAVIDTDNKTYKAGYFIKTSDPLITTKKEIIKLINKCKDYAIKIK